MAYILTEASKNNSDQWACGARAYDTRKQALTVFHQTMASAMSNPSVVYCICHVLEEDGVPAAQDIYRADTQ